MNRRRGSASPIEILLKRAYEPPAKADGVRVLVDRLWPRGVTKEHLKLDVWAKELAPSTELRKWFGHDPTRWPEFQKRYRHELENAGSRERILGILAQARDAPAITLVYGARDTEHNGAVVLREVFRRLASATD